MLASLELSELQVIAATAAPGPPKEERTENKGKGEKNERRRWTGIAAGCCCLAVLGGNAGWSCYKWSLVVVPRSRQQNGEKEGEGKEKVGQRAGAKR